MLASLAELDATLEGRGNHCCEAVNSDAENLVGFLIP